MATLDFFAVREDYINIFDRLFSTTDVQVFEGYSEYDQELRHFRSTQELLGAFPLGVDTYGNSFAHHLQLWSPSVAPEPEIQRINLVRVKGHTHRFCVHGMGLMQFHTGGVFGDRITKSNFGHFSEKGARARAVGNADEVDWVASRKLSNKIIYLIKCKLRVARVPFWPVLAGALELHRGGYKLRYGTRDLQLITDDASVTEEKPGHSLMRVIETLK